MSIQLIIGLVIVAALAGSHWYAYHAGGENRENAILAETVKTEAIIHDTALEVRQEIGREVGDQVAKIRVVNRTINNEVQREIHEKPVYLNPDCAAPVTGVVQLNAARRGNAGGAGPGGDAAVPRAPDVRREEGAPTR